jgi:hemerythrin
MGNFAWQADYSVGDETIDGQHRKLIEILNKLGDLLGGGRADAAVTPRQLFDDLALYVTSHFAYEEKRMADAGYPLEKVREHQQEHRQLLKTLQGFETHVESGDPQALEEMMPFLYGDWLIHHICVVDKDYADYL